MPTYYITPVDYLDFDADPSGNTGSSVNTSPQTRPNLGLRANKPYLKALGQTQNNSTSAPVANQPLGVVALPAIAAATTGTVTITNSLIGTTSYIFTQLRRGSTVPAVGAQAITAFATPPTAGSCVINIRNAGATATLATDFQLWYLIVN